jgi:hypothetical protein
MSALLRISDSTRRIALNFASCPTYYERLEARTVV